MRIKLTAFFVSMVMLVSGAAGLSAAAARKGPDLIVSDLRISNPYFRPGDDISFEIDVKNIGDEVCPSGWVWLSVKEGALNRKGSAQGGSWSKMYVYPGETITFEIMDFIASGDTIVCSALCDSAKNVEETNENNNSAAREFKVIKSSVDLEITDIKISPAEFAAGDEVSLELFLKNNGTEALPYTEAEGELTVNGRVHDFKTVQAIAPGGEVSFVIGGIYADSTHLKVTADINGGRKIQEGVYTNNSIEKDLYSVKEVDYSWDTVRIGGGGYVPYMALHPSDPDAVYIGTDVGGAYRRDNALEEWIPITDSLILRDGNLAGISSIELDAEDSGTVYIAAGESRSGSEGIARQSDVFRSYDKGRTFTGMNIPGGFVGSNTKSYKYLLKLDPNNSNVLYAACPIDGLYRTQNARGRTVKWEKLRVPCFEAASDYNNMMTGVAIDPGSVSEGRSSVIYVSLAAKGICRSTDGGATFELMEGSPKRVYGMLISKNGELYAHTAAGEGGILKFDGSAWKSIAPYKDWAYTGFSINPNDENMLVASARTEIYFSDNGGLSWRSAKKDYTSVFEAPWAPDDYFANTIGYIYFDPCNNKTVWFGDWFGVWKTEDITAHKPVWKSAVRGLEELCVRCIKPSPGEARLFVGVMDNNGMTVNDVFDFPDSRFENPWCQDTNSIDFAEGAPEFAVRVGGMKWGSGPGNGGYSTDGGKTWNEFEDYPKKKDNAEVKNNNGSVVMAAKPNEDGVVTIIAMPTKNAAFRTVDYGKTWEKVDSLPENLYKDFNHYNEPVDADTMNKDIFYAYDSESGSFYVSTNNGKSFVKTCTLPKGDYRHGVAAVPGMEGHIFVYIGGEGLYYSSDCGKSFEKIQTVESALCFSIGKEAPGSALPSLYIYGRINGVTGIYRSCDFGESWEKIKAAAEDMKTVPGTLKADRKDFGIIYMSCRGRGVNMGIPAGYDIQPPRVVVNTKLDGETIKQCDFEVKGTVTEPAEVFCVINGETLTAETDGNNKFSFCLKLKDGENSAVFYAEDRNGLKSEETSYSFIHDADFVKLTVDQSSGIYTRDSFTITGSVNGLNADGAVSINGSTVPVNPKTLKFSCTVPIAEGINVFCVKAWDDNGNTAEKVLEMNYDTEPPAVTFENAGITTDNVLYLLRGKTNEAVSISVGDYTYQMQYGESTEFVLPLQLKSGANEFKLVLTDLAGNKTETSVNAVYEAQEYVPANDKEIMVYNAEEPPKIDGILDSGEWYLNRVANKTVSGTTGAYAVFGLKGDLKYLYAAVRVWDNKVVPGNSSEYNMDSAELFFDPELNRSVRYDATDHQVRISLQDDVKGLKTNEGVKTAHTVTEDGYIIEAAIPWTSLDINYKKGGKFGFDISVNDNSAGPGTARDGVIGWAGDANNYQNTSLFGTAVIE